MPETRVGNFQVTYLNSEEFHEIKREIFGQHAYYLDLETETPRILDIGAHIGLATLYFASQFPHATIEAIEPNPDTFEYLEHNVTVNHLDQVKLHNVAVSDQEGTAQLHRDASDEQWFSSTSIHSGAWNRQQVTEPFRVSTKPLSFFLSEQADLVKMDIEGAEERVLIAARDFLHNIHHLVIEWHPLPEQSLPRFVRFLEQNGFVFSTRPAVNRETVSGSARDLLLLEARNTRFRPTRNS